MANIEQVFNVNDMGSDKERQAVVDAVSALEGVDECSLAKGSVRKIVVVYDPTVVSEEDVIAAVAETGYEVG